MVKIRIRNLVLCLSGVLLLSVLAEETSERLTGNTNLAINLPVEFIGATITVKSCTNLITAGWSTMLQTNAESSGAFALCPLLFSSNTVSMFYKMSASSTVDSDSDGLDNIAEYELGTDYLMADTDRDGLDDAWELLYSLNPLIADSGGDIDGDGLSNVQEYWMESSPTNQMETASLGLFDVMFFQPEGL